MLDDEQKKLLISLETIISEITENAWHPVHDPKHPKHAESLAAFNKLLVMRENLVFTDGDNADSDNDN